MVCCLFHDQVHQEAIEHTETVLGLLFQAWEFLETVPECTRTRHFRQKSQFSGQGHCLSKTPPPTCRGTPTPTPTPAHQRRLDTRAFGAQILAPSALVASIFWLILGSDVTLTHDYHTQRYDIIM